MPVLLGVLVHLLNIEFVFKERYDPAHTVLVSLCIGFSRAFQMIPYSILISTIVNNRSHVSEVKQTPSLQACQKHFILLHAYTSGSFDFVISIYFICYMIL